MSEKKRASRARATVEIVTGRDIKGSKWAAQYPDKADDLWVRVHVAGKRKKKHFGPPTEENLRQMKSATVACERQFLFPDSERRMINLDPGVLTVDHLVLASHKSAGHRLYLGDGVYAELELWYVNGGFEPLPWTYLDYKTKEARVFFEKTRAVLLGRKK